MKSQTLHETECGASRSNGYALLDRKLSAPLDMLLTTEHNWCRWHQTNNNSTTLTWNANYSTTAHINPPL